MSTTNEAALETQALIKPAEAMVFTAILTPCETLGFRWRPPGGPRTRWQRWHFLATNSPTTEPSLTGWP
jgi:hypothetical protein